jgi:hypothetical protein
MTEYNVSNSGIIEFYGTLEECTNYLLDKSQYVKQNWLISLTGEQE